MSTAGSLQEPRQLQRGDEGAMQAEHLGRISICDALVAAGFDTLDKQADVLSLPRSTTWSVLHGNHKKSGLSAGPARADAEIATAPPIRSGKNH